MKSDRLVLLLALVVGLSQFQHLSNAQLLTITQSASKDSSFYATFPAYAAGHDDALTIGGPADIYSAIAFTSNAPAGATVTDFRIVFDIQENPAPVQPVSLNIMALNGPWDENSTRNGISGFGFTPLGSLTLSTSVLNTGERIITFSGPLLTSLYASGQLANGIFWQDNDLRTVFPNGATAFSRETTTGPVGSTSYTVPEPSTWAIFAVALTCVILARRHSGTSAQRVAADA